jgi:hypothetical protein
MYDSQFGTDKIAHFFAEGFDYFKKYKAALREGLKETEASAKAIEWGRKTEKGFYGTWISGVFSNADLAANFGGMKFYQGLTKEIAIGDKKRPPVLLLQNGVWIFNEKFNSQEMLLKPFISDHFNEALNPSIFTELFGLRSHVREVLTSRACKQWSEQFPNVSKIDFEKKTAQLQSWNGDDYGFAHSENFVTISNTCFDQSGSYSSTQSKTVSIR